MSPDTMIPEEYKWLLSEKAPAILVQALKLYGTMEVKGEASNPVIIKWAQEVGGWIGGWYNKDSIPWCGLFMAVVCKRAGLPYNQRALSALSWAAWGDPVGHAMLGDVMTFTRDGGGHVGIYVGEDDRAYHILGGNQSDAVTITRILKDRLYDVRRTRWRWRQPDNVRRIFLSPDGEISHNES